ncbi:MAG TPA: DinB family protein [Chitinophagaceae bacterium]|nr:DinB family protein [Chitinophagaceae bacterium]
MQQLIETWQIHNRINLYLLNAVDDSWLADLPASKGRTVGEQFAHIHNVRFMWFKAAGPELLEKVSKIEKDAITKKLLAEQLIKSGDAMSALLQKGFESGKIKGFKPNTAAFLGYFISHESHHRGQIMLCLKQSGHKVDQKVQYGLWEWGSR